MSIEYIIREDEIGIGKHLEINMKGLLSERLTHPDMIAEKISLCYKLIKDLNDMDKKYQDVQVKVKEPSLPEHVLPDGNYHQEDDIEENPNRETL